MRIVITGATGYIGSNLLVKLIYSISILGIMSMFWLEKNQIYLI